MSFLDANVAQLASSSAAVEDATTMFGSVLGQAEATAAQAQAVHVGQSSMAFQSAHARFVSGATKLKMLLGQAGLNVGEGGQTYTMVDAQGADDYNAVPISDGGDISIRA